MASSIGGTSLTGTSIRTQSEMYLSTVGNNPILRRQTFKEKLKEFVHFLVDAESGKVFNRTPFDWVMLIALHLGIILSCLLMMAGFMAIVYVGIIDWNIPYLQGPHSLIQTPGMSFRPQPDYQSTVVRFVKGETTTYTHYADHLEAYMRYYENENQQGENFIDCSEIRGRRVTDLNKVCRFNIEWLGGTCVKQVNYGFDDGQPCILLKLNKVFNWFPQEYSNYTVPDEIRDYWNQWAITVRCDGETAADRENMGPLTYFPSDGFHFKFFPYRNQQGYRSPIMFVRFEEPKPGNLLMITCKAYASNIIHNRVEMAGMTHFELIVD